MTGSGMSSATLDERLNTPSTTTDSSKSIESTPDLKRQIPTAGDLNQWVKKPKGLGVLGQ